METELLRNLTGLAAFAKVVETESFTRAAEALGISKSAVSKQVSDLEERFGTRLLNRTTRKIGLTEMGTQIYQRCRRILEEIEAAEHDAGSAQSAPAGLIRMTAGVSFSQRVLAPIMPAFLRENPRITLDIVVNDRKVDLIEEGYDLGLRVGEEPDTSLIAQRLSPIRQVVTASPDYLARRGAPTSPRDLRNHDCLAFGQGGPATIWEFDGPGGGQRLRITSRYQVNNGDMLIDMAEAGDGINFGPTFIAADSIRSGRLVPVLTDHEPKTLTLYAIYPHTRQLSVKVRALLDYLALHFTDDPTWDRDLF
jgi:DNA-binding transcriptional LysR family regulator